MHNQQIKTKKEILNYFKDWDLDLESRDYINYHALRYEILLSEIEKILRKTKNKARILDLGPAYQTELLRNNLPDIPVDSLGFDDKRFKRRNMDKHFQFDLNLSQDKNKWIKVGEYNIVIMAELIEHLYTSPKLVLGFVSNLVRKNGVLIIQTPNAVSLDRRAKMILGKHPYEMIRENNLNPGHFREYTIGELVSAAKDAGFKIKESKLENYFLHKRKIKGLIYDFCCQILPQSFKHGITLILQKN